MIRKSFSSTPALSFLSAGAFLALACAADPLQGGNVPGPQSQGVETGSSSEKEVDVLDPLSRWRSRVSVSGVPTRRTGVGAESLVEVESLPGYVHAQLRSSGRTEGPVVHCFVYEHLVHPGEGVDQMLRGIAPGIRLLSFSPLRVFALRGEPLIQFSLRFEPTDGGTARSFGALVYPQEQFPVVCSVEDEQIRPSTWRLMQQFVRQFRPSRTEEGRARWELFAIDSPRDHSPIGFLSRRSIEREEQQVLTERLTTFHLSTEQTKNLDRVVREAIDPRGGLRWVQWFELLDGQVLFRGQVAVSETESTETPSGGDDPRPGLRYRYGVEFRAEVKKGHFYSTDIIGSALSFGWGWGGQIQGRELVLQPYLSPLGPSRCELSSSEAVSCLRCSPVAVSEKENWPFGRSSAVVRTQMVSDNVFGFSDCEREPRDGKPPDPAAAGPRLSILGGPLRGTTLRLLDSNR